MVLYRNGGIVTAPEEKTETNILDAIRKAFTDVEEFSQKFEKKPPQSIFMNRNRQAIFAYLCAHPCATMMKISTDMKMSTTTARWHLRLLVDNNFLSVSRSGDRAVYYPKDFIPIAQVGLLSRLNEPVTKNIMSAIIRTPGAIQKELCTKLGLKHQTLIYNTSKLIETGLLIAMKDGKFTRYYPTEMLSKLRERNIKQVNQFRRSLLKMLKRDGVSPRIARTTYGELHVEVARGSERAMLVLYTDPFVTVLS